MQTKTPINNTFYDDLNEKWHTALDHPVALLRAENELRNPWIIKTIGAHFENPCKILDIGCGAGFLTHSLSQENHQVFGIDLSEKSLNIAREKDATKRIQFLRASAYELPYEKEFFDVVCAMDLLEHVEHPAVVVKEASRVLKKNGLFFFHTFNRNWLSYLLVIKGVEWCFYNTPQNMHVYPLFLKPKELIKMCSMSQMTTKVLLGVKPDFGSLAFWKMVLSRRMDPALSFKFHSSLKTGYCGYALKR